MCHHRRIIVERAVFRIAEARRDLGQDRGIERQRAVFGGLPFGVDLLGKSLGAELVYQDLDARLVDVVAATERIVGAQNRFDVADDIALMQKRLDGLGQEWCAPKAAADHHLEADFAGAVAVQPQRHVVDRQGGAIVAGGADRDLEFARQEREFRM